jgi:uncharacterized membrane protein
MAELDPMTPALARKIGEETLEAQREREKRQKMRSIAIALALVALVILFYAATIVRLGGNVINRAL